LAQNKHTPADVIKILATHPVDLIRAETAKKSMLITDVDILKKLALDKYEIRLQLARSTNNEDIKVLLFKSNPHHLDIQLICLKRIKDMAKIEELLMKKSNLEECVGKIADSLLYNPSLNARILEKLIEYAKELSNEQIDLIAKLESTLNEIQETGEHI
jgi:hypothetical protein